MTIRIQQRLAMLVLSAFMASACTSQPTFKPEVEGPGAMSARGGVVYSVPPEDPVLKMKLVSLGINKDNMAHVRLFFLRKGAPAGELLDPKEQSLTLADSTSLIYPARIHAIANAKPLIKLDDRERQVVELLFAVPKGSHQYPYVSLNWKVHYRKNGQDKVMDGTDRFDLVEKNEPQAGVGSYSGDLEFPDIGAAPFPDEWASPGLLWW